MYTSLFPKTYEHPLRVIGIILGNTNSVMTEINWQPGSTLETNVIQIEQDTPRGLIRISISTKFDGNVT